MTQVNILFFSLGKHDVAGNKRMKNLSKYLKKDHFVETKVIRPVWDYFNIESRKGISYFLLKMASLLGNIILFPIVLIKEKKKNASNLLYFYEAEHLMFHRLLLAKLLGFRMVLDLVENPAPTPFTFSFLKRIRIKYFLLVYKVLPLFFSGVVVVSGFLKKKIIKDFKNKVSVFILPVSYDPDDFLIVAEKIPHSIFYGGSYGSNYDFLSFFKVLEKVFAAFPKMKLYLSGKVPGEIVDLIKKHPILAKSVIFLGFLSEDNYFKTISGVDVLCLPRNNSIQANAGFPFKLAEYLATGNPVITSRVSDVDEYLTSNDAFLYEPENSNELKSKLFEILANMPKARIIGSNGKKTAEKYFNASNQAKYFLKFLQGKNN